MPCADSGTAGQPEHTSFEIFRNQAKSSDCVTGSLSVCQTEETSANSHAYHPQAELTLPFSKSVLNFLSTTRITTENHRARPRAPQGKRAVCLLSGPGGRPEAQRDAEREAERRPARHQRPPHTTCPGARAPPTAQRSRYAPPRRAPLRGSGSGREALRPPPPAPLLRDPRRRAVSRWQARPAARPRVTGSAGHAPTKGRSLGPR